MRWLFIKDVMYSVVSWLSHMWLLDYSIVVGGSFQAGDGIRVVTGVKTCALPGFPAGKRCPRGASRRR